MKHRLILKIITSRLLKIIQTAPLTWNILSRGMFWPLCVMGLIRRRYMNGFLVWLNISQVETMSLSQLYVRWNVWEVDWITEIYYHNSYTFRPNYISEKLALTVCVCVSHQLTSGYRIHRLQPIGYIYHIKVLYCYWQFWILRITKL